MDKLNLSETELELQEQLRNQDLPDDINCPRCGESMSDDFKVKHRLSQFGYIHDDIELRCDECSYKWTHGVPIGSPQWDMFGTDLFCRVCTEGYMRTHFVKEPEDDQPVYFCDKCGRQYKASMNRRPCWQCDDGQVTKEMLDKAMEISLKCGNCYHYKKIMRPVNDNGFIMTGYPDIVGRLNTEMKDGYKTWRTDQYEDEEVEDE